MSETYTEDRGETVENPDAGAYENERPDNRDRRYDDGGGEEHPEGGEREERAPQRRPNPDRAAARLRTEAREARERAERAERAVEELRRERQAPVDPFSKLASVDKFTDPLGKIDALEEIALGLQRREQNDAQSRQQQQAQQAHIAGLSRWASEFEADFKDTHPDYDKAVDHVARSLTADLKAGGMSDQQAAQELARQLTTVLESCRTAGNDPAQAIYAIAQRRGYKLDNGADMTQQRNGSRGTSPFAGTGTRSGGGGVSVASVGNAPKSSVSAIRAGGDDFDKGFAKLKANAKPRRY